MKKIILAAFIVLLTLGFISTSLKGTTTQTKDSDINVEDSHVSDVLTFDEIVKEIANDNEILVKDAQNQMIQISKNDTISLQDLSNDEIVSVLASKTYRIVSTKFTVTSAYKPTIKVYCETAEGENDWEIVKVSNVGMNRTYNNVSKEFNGDIYANLENSNTIYWIVNGDFYNNGTTIFSKGVDDEESEFSGKFNASNAENFYAYCYKDGRYKKTENLFSKTDF